MKQKKAEQKVAAVAAQAPGPDVLMEVAYNLVQPDPDQPRREFDAASLQELADSIAAVGLQQPPIVQRVQPRLAVYEPDLTSDKWRVVARDGSGTTEFDNEGPARLYAAGEDKESYQIVMGERRWRAVGLLGWAKIPVIVRDVDARKKFLAQFTENHQRVNLSALEEAQAFQRELNKRQEVDANFSVADLAQELGMKRSTAYELLKLTRLCPAVEVALRAGKIEVSVAQVMTQIPDPGKQVELLKTILNENNWNYPFSVREVQELVQRDYIKQLKEASFDTKRTDWPGEESVQLAKGKSILAALVRGACQACAWRSGNMAEQMPELAKRPNVCTNTACFDAKMAVHAAERMVEAAQAGQEVISAEAYSNQYHRYKKASDTCWRVDGEKTWAKLAAAANVTPRVALTRSGQVEEVLDKEQQRQVLDFHGVKDYAEESRKSDAKLRKQVAKWKHFAEVATAAMLAKVAVDDKKTGVAVPVKLWGLLAIQVNDKADIDSQAFVAKRRGLADSQNDVRDALDKWLEETEDPVELARFVVELLVCASWNGRYGGEPAWSDHFKALADQVTGVEISDLVKANLELPPGYKPVPGKVEYMQDKQGTLALSPAGKWLHASLPAEPGKLKQETLLPIAPKGKAKKKGKK